MNLFQSCTHLIYFRHVPCIERDVPLEESILALEVNVDDVGRTVIRYDTGDGIEQTTTVDA